MPDPSDQGEGAPPLVRADQPWADQELAALYDLFPFDADLPLYLELAAATHGRVLELACGSGRVLVPLVSAGHEVTGVDASPHMLALAERKLAALPEHARARGRVIEADMRAFALPETFALAIVAVRSFAYLTEPGDQLAALDRVAAHLRPSGMLALDLLHPSCAWLAQPPGSVRQDLAQRVNGGVVTRTETTVHTDVGAQIRVLRSAYEHIDARGRVTKRIVEWPFRYTYRFEAEHLLARAGLVVEAVYGGYAHEPYTADAEALLLLARKP